MPTTKEMTVEQLARALTQLSPKEFESLVEILDRENIKKRRTIVRREAAKGKIVGEKELFRNLR